jgi:hypothetical protein
MMAFGRTMGQVVVAAVVALAVAWACRGRGIFVHERNQHRKNWERRKPRRGEGGGGGSGGGGELRRGVAQTAVRVTTHTHTMEG